MHTVSAAEANRQFSSLLRQVSQGETVTVLSHGRPVATISPAVVGTELDHDRTKARARLLARLDGEPVADNRNWTRAELYDRGQ
ncbi:type II toxin-antitoxin system Phd/YefM family antitoxin [Thauera mechernichensis]|uniref:Antitoxin n=1 Tax=Thauera mechernichensis TaxID=82788 RepID=A0ABW3WEC3_9RHOO|nr:MULTISPECIES: type II toxin-antitoxin system prevent-host-death family antitoxin [Thauera]ENO76221.1 prevent-host-death family protein [Thauera sp. 27]ENO94870.1 prevent-host-death family protein [Thauera sp. 28]MDG3063937.1 type II toxin-antitoxin system prevent-host-death family antitoxin [Thauera mechernichensis]WBL65741.1 type II toxin-antitoxin system prevent-host-death family antitoxin [Thauera sp. WB-2]HAG75030.1 type II toxin-antitoxin system prevent-host-death family antitoxin [Tha